MARLDRGYPGANRDSRHHRQQRRRVRPDCRSIRPRSAIYSDSWRSTSWAPSHWRSDCCPPCAHGASGLHISVGSVADHNGFPENSVYSATKYGLRGLHESLSAEYRGSGVRFTLVSPGPTDTAIWDSVSPLRHAALSGTQHDAARRRRRRCDTFRRHAPARTSSSTGSGWGPRDTSTPPSGVDPYDPARIRGSRGPRARRTARGRPERVPSTTRQHRVGRARAHRHARPAGRHLGRNLRTGDVSPGAGSQGVAGLPARQHGHAPSPWISSRRSRSDRRGEIWYGTVGNGWGLSLDGGATWRNWAYEQLGPEWQYVAPSGIAIRGDTTMIATADGLQITTDDGGHWTAIGDAHGSAGQGPGRYRVRAALERVRPPPRH